MFRQSVATHGRVLLSLAVLLTVAAVVIGAQIRTSRAEVSFASSADIDAAIARVAAGDTPTARFLPDEEYQYFAATRKAPGAPEIHTRWTDVTFVRAGHGVLRTGRALTGQREVSPGEWRGETIVDVADRPLGAGDVLVIHAGRAHQLSPVGSDPLVYVTIKIPSIPSAADAPTR